MHAENSAWWWISLAGALVVSALLATAGVAVSLIAPVLPSVRWLVTPLLLAAIVTPGMLAAEFTRRWLFKIDRADLVAAFALIYFFILTGSAIVATRLSFDASAGALAWASASLSVTILALCFLRPMRVSRPVMGRIIRDHRSEAGWLASANLPYSVYSSATIVILIGMLIGPIAAGIFTAARTLINPAMSIVSAIDSTDKPRATRALAENGMAGLHRAITRTRALIALTTGAYLGAVALWADQLATLVYDEHYSNVTFEVRLLALAFFLAGLNQPSETRLIVLKAGRAMLIVRSITALLAIAGLSIAASWGVIGMAIAITGIQMLNLLLLWLAERRAVSKRIVK
jgi:O-antigen/teichoic acid export membrane protein